jgi:protein-tyrosine-phosphatase
LSEYPKLKDTIEVLKDHGMDILNEQCTQLVPEHLQDVSKIIVMTEREDIPEWLQKFEYEYWEVPNPDPVTREVAEAEFILIKTKVAELL